MHGLYVTVFLAILYTGIGTKGFVQHDNMWETCILVLFEKGRSGKRISTATSHGPMSATFVGLF